MSEENLRTFADVFSGIGGFRLALERRGLRCVFSSEIDEHARKAYAANFGDEPAGDIREIDAAAIPDHDVLCGGFPCQSFSLAGTKTAGRKGLSDPRGALFFEIVRIAGAKRPAVLLLENVRGLVSLDKGRTVRDMERALAEAGYRTTRNVLNAADYGIPQNRERVYFVCLRDDIDWGWQPPLRRPPVLLRDVLMPEDHPEILPLRLQRDDLVWEEAKPRGLLRRVGYLSRYVRKKKLLSHDGAIHAADGVAPRRNKDGKLLDSGQNNAVYSPEGVSPTCGVGSGNAKGREKVGKPEYGYARTLHQVEKKRIMGFPDNWIVSKGGRGDGQLGNAVIPAMVELLVAGLYEA